MSTADFSLLLCRVAESCGWACVSQYEHGAAFVIDMDESSSAEVIVDEVRGLAHARCDVIALDGTTGSAEETLRLLLVASGETRETGGLSFALSGDQSHILLGASLRLDLDETDFTAQFSGLIERSAAWRTVLGAETRHPSTPDQNTGTEYVIRA